MKFIEVLHELSMEQKQLSWKDKYLCFLRPLSRTLPNYIS